MARIAEAELERLKADVPVAGLIEASGVKLTRQGADLAGLCPFHAEDTPSLKVTPSKNLCHCFGCGVGGGPIDWVMKRRGVSFRHAVELLREDAGLAEAPAAATRSTVRVLESPVSLDEDDAAVLARVVAHYHARLKRTPMGAGLPGAARQGRRRGGDRAIQAGVCRSLARPAATCQAARAVVRAARAAGAAGGVPRERARALHRLAGDPGARCGGPGGGGVWPQDHRQFAARHAAASLFAGTASRGVEPAWHRRERRRGDPVRGADRRTDLLVRRLSQRHRFLWGGRVHRRACGSIPAAQRPPGAGRLRPRRGGRAGRGGADRAAASRGDRLPSGRVPERAGRERLRAEGDAGGEVPRRAAAHGRWAGPGGSSGTGAGGGRSSG